MHIWDLVLNDLLAQGTEVIVIFSESLISHGSVKWNVQLQSFALVTFCFPSNPPLQAVTVSTSVLLKCSVSITSCVAMLQIQNEMAIVDLRSSQEAEVSQFSL